MWTTLLSLFQSGLRAYKIQDVRKVRYGIVVKGLDELITKGCKKLKIPTEDVRVVLASDGTVVDNNKFFKKLPPQTVLVFLHNDETWTGDVTALRDTLSIMFDTKRKEELMTQIYDLLTGEASAEKMHMMSQYLALLDTNIEAEKLEDDMDWFKGYGTRFKTKSEALTYTAQSRIRSYYNSARDQIERDYKGDNRVLLQYVLDQMNEKLQDNDYHGHYFSRKSLSKERFCDRDGWFMCEGPYDEKSCDQNHSVNPYASLGYRYLFGLWNLDHIIEKSREVIPRLCEAADRIPDDMELDADLVYDLLFTRKNLKIVYISCHDKASRPENTVNVEDFFLSYA